MSDAQRHALFVREHLADCAAALEFDAPRPSGKGYPEPGQTWVYFIAWDGGPIKIGFTNDLSARLQCLQTACPYALSILWAFEGGEGDERALHARFGSKRLLNEWFERCPEIEAEIDRRASEATVSASLTNASKERSHG